MSWTLFWQIAGLISLVAIWIVIVHSSVVDKKRGRS